MPVRIRAHDRKRRGDPPSGKRNAEIPEKLDEVGGPAACDGRRADAVSQREVSADEPREEFAHGGVGIRVGAAGTRDHRCELGIVQAREGAGDSRQDERERDAGPRAVRRDRSLDLEDARANHDADPEKHEAHGAEFASEFRRLCGA